MAREEPALTFSAFVYAFDDSFAQIKGFEKYDFFFFLLHIGVPRSSFHKTSIRYFLQENFLSQGRRPDEEKIYDPLPYLVAYNANHLLFPPISVKYPARVSSAANKIRTFVRAVPPSSVVLLCVAKGVRSTGPLCMITSRILVEDF